MNSTVSDDLTRENLAFESAKCLKEILINSRKVTSLHKHLLEVNLSITAYVEESKKLLASIRLDLAHKAKSSQQVVEILSEKSPATPHKRNPRTRIKSIQEDNNNTSNKFSDHQQARSFISWYKCMIDNERQNLALYISDDATLEWFGRTIKTRKKVTAFLKYDMQCSRHDFTSIESIDKIQTRLDSQRKGDTILASPLTSPEIVKTERPGKRRLLRSSYNSPEWAEGCQPLDEINIDKKKLKTKYVESERIEDNYHNNLKRAYPDEDEISHNGDCVVRKMKRKCVPVTPPNCEVGQGDCLPSTSGTDSDRSHDTLNAQLPKLAVECNGYIKFTRTRNNRSTDTMQWERKCKVQISYSEDPLNVGEYIIWALRYSDESKCRRNLLAAFEEVANAEGRDM